MFHSHHIMVYGDARLDARRDSSAYSTIDRFGCVSSHSNLCCREDTRIGLVFRLCESRCNKILIIARGKDYGLTLTTETKPTIMLLVNLLVHVDIEKTYKIGLEIAKDNNAIFQGIMPWSFPNPNRDVQYLSFIADVDSINKIIEKVKSGLKITEENLLYSVTPSIRPKEKPPSNMTA